MAELRVITFRPLNFGRWVIWGFTALLFALLPAFFSKGFALTLMSQMGIMIVFALSYNMLLGQSGMLSFGHAVYSGLGAFFAMHAMNRIAAGSLDWPISLLPLIAGLAGGFFGVHLRLPDDAQGRHAVRDDHSGHRRDGIRRLADVPGLLRRRGGHHRQSHGGAPLFGISSLTFGPQIQVYYLIAVWCVACMVAMFALTQTPLGRIANAVRDNPERAEFIGYNTQRVRWLMLILSSFFAGIAGGLTAINFEIVSAENVSAVRSGGVLLAAFIGGASFFFGPILGAIVFVFFSVALSEYTKAWQLYLGVFFVALVMFAPGGLASLLLMNLRVMKFGKFKRLRDPYVGVLLTALTAALGTVMLIELTYHVTLDTGQGPVTRLFGIPMDTGAPGPWVLAAFVLLCGALAFEYYRRHFAECWSEIQIEIEDWIRDNPT